MKNTHVYDVAFIRNVSMILKGITNGTCQLCYMRFFIIYIPALAAKDLLIYIINTVDNIKQIILYFKFIKFIQSKYFKQYMQQMVNHYNGHTTLYFIHSYDL